MCGGGSSVRRIGRVAGELGGIRSLLASPSKAPRGFCSARWLAFEPATFCFSCCTRHQHLLLCPSLEELDCHHELASPYIQTFVTLSFVSHLQITPSPHIPRRVRIAATRHSLTQGSRTALKRNALVFGFALFCGPPTAISSGHLTPQLALHTRSPSPSLLSPAPSFDHPPSLIAIVSLSARVPS